MRQMFARINYMVCHPESCADCELYHVEKINNELSRGYCRVTGRKAKAREKDALCPLVLMSYEGADLWEVVPDGSD